MGGDGLTNEGLKHIAQISALERFSAHFNQHITDAGVAHLKDMPNLKMLDLYFAALTNQSARMLGDMPQLELLTLPGSCNDFESLAHLTRLKSLWCHVPNDTSLEVMSGFTRLEKLHFGYDHITLQGIKHLAALKNLNRLWIFDPLPEGSCDLIAGLENLDDISLSGLTLGQINKLNQLKHIKSASFRQIKDDGSILNLSNWTRLGYLYLPMEEDRDKQTRERTWPALLQDEDIQWLTHTPNLNFLCLAGIKISDQGFGFIAGLKKLGSLQVYGPTVLTDDGVKQLSTDTPLSALRIDQGHFTSVCLTHLEKFAYLDILELTSDTAFKPRDINAFKRNNHVELLQLLPNRNR
jgi:hypothetical protein